MVGIYFPFNIIIISILISSGLSAQPNYPGRLNLFRSDSTESITLSQDAASGTVDEDLYFVGPGDVLKIFIKNNNPQFLVSEIDHEGNLFLDKLGSVNLSGKNLANAKFEIKKLLSSIFNNSDFVITLVKIKRVKVNLTGYVKNIQSLTFPGNYRLVDILSTSKFLFKDSDLRNISVISYDGNERSYDLISFIRLGESIQNPYLRDGDLINIKKADKLIYAYGELLYPGVYEFKAGETLGHLLKITGGFTAYAKSDSIELIRFSKDGKNQSSIITNVSKSETNIELLPFDKIVVRRLQDYLIDRTVTIEGFVKYPGIYRIEKDKTKLSELLLNYAGGFLPNASLKDSYVIRQIGLKTKDPEFERLSKIPRADMTEDEYDYLKAFSRQTAGKMVVDFERLFLKNDSSEDLILKRGDKIVIPESVNYISLVGQVNYPGNITYQPGRSVYDYIELAGGFSWRAEEGDVRVIRADSGEWLEADDVDRLFPGDVIWVPEKPPAQKFWDVFKDVVFVIGQAASLAAAIAAIVIATSQ